MNDEQAALTIAQLVEKKNNKTCTILKNRKPKRNKTIIKIK